MSHSGLGQEPLLTLTEEELALTTHHASNAQTTNTG